MREQFRPGPQVSKSEYFCVDVPQPLYDCGHDNEHGYVPSEEAMDEWYGLFYRLTGMEYGPPSPYAHELLTLDIVPVIGVKGEYPTYIGLIGTYLEEKPVKGSIADSFSSVEVSTLLQIDAHGGNRDYISYAEVGDDEFGDPPADAWRALSPELSTEVARMFSRHYTDLKQHTRTNYGG